MSEMNAGGMPAAETTVTHQRPAPGTEALIPKGEPTVVGDREARPDASPTEESYTDKGPLTPDTWKQKLEKFRKDKNLPAKELGKPAAPAAEPAKAAKVEEQEEPAAQVQAEVEQPAGEEAAPEVEAEAPAEGEEAANAPAFKVNPKFSIIGKEYELPKYLAEAITTPEQEQEVKDLYTKAMGLDHVKMRHQELTDKYTTLETTHKEVTEGIQDMAEIYREAVQTQNPLLLNDFFAQMQIPVQVVLQYAQAVQQYLELDPAQQQIVAGQLEAHRRARTVGKQNQQLAQSSFQSTVQAHRVELDSVLARPEVSTSVQQFEAMYGPGSFREELIRNGVYVEKAENRVLSAADNVNQVLARFRLQSQQPAGGQAPAPQVPGARVPPAPRPLPRPPPRKAESPWYLLSRTERFPSSQA